MMNSQVARRLVKKLALEKHSEGGYFKQTYRSDTMVNVEGFDGPRSIATAIYYMLAGDQFSAFHRIRSDEIWHHYAGGSITLYTIDDKDGGRLSKVKIGGKGGIPQVVIKAGTWFAAALDNRKSYCLLGCTVSPGFDYRDWELGKRDELIRMYPQHRKIIERYTK
ncbi:putative enolase [Candidatus Nitrososphaera gargensis Ga9.2]|uniref:Putative enolase n=1 Tax=Nitrososphaera gargensis (strain Ga9.2) TaxID=1237085 RepID=K0IE49_NITGG|nr:cupin domain-containing protein [Candidatus Nitrososphaera gargensis]AFU57093.1 putative enolase [Candidatus Nitrososphaera gargensis Ga9.2]